MNRYRRKADVSRPGAFTLIELLVVIAVIAILAAMLLPSLSRSKAQAQSIVCKNHLHEMGIALRMYVDDYKAYPYYIGEDIGVQHWYGSLQLYYRLKWSNPAFHCPAYTGVVTVDGANELEWGSYSYNVGGAAEAPLGVNYSYGLGQDSGGTSPKTDNQVVVPSATFAFMDTLPTITYAGLLQDTEVWDPASYFRMGMGPSGQDWAGCFPGAMYFAGANADLNNGRLQHGSVVNMAYGDAHVDSIPAKVLYSPTTSAPNWNYDHQAHEDLWPPP